MTFNFTPTEREDTKVKVPYIEEARSDFAPYYKTRGTSWTVAKAQGAVIQELAKLGAGGSQFREGYFGANPRRYGYLLTFSYMGGSGQMQVAGLPIKNSETDSKVREVRIQALLNLRDWLKAAVTTRVFAPGMYPLMQYLLVDGQRTLAEVAIERGDYSENNPLLGDGS